MIKLSTIAIIAVTFLTTPSAFSQGDMTGGGGHAVVCKENGRTTYQMYDLYEAERESERTGVDYRPKLGGSTLTLDQKITLVEERYAKKDPKRAQDIATEARAILTAIRAAQNGDQKQDHLVVFTKTPLYLREDSDEVYEIPSHCKKLQLAVQEKMIRPTDPVYTVHAPLWNALNDDQRTALLFHEALYREFRSLGIYTSRGVRVMNQYILSDQITEIGLCSYMDLIENAGLTEFYLLGSIPRVNFFKTCSADGRITGAKLRSAQPIQINQIEFDVQALEFSEQGEVKKILFTFYKFKSGVTKNSESFAEYSPSGTLIVGDPNRENDKTVYEVDAQGNVLRYRERKKGRQTTDEAGIHGAVEGFMSQALILLSQHRESPEFELNLARGFHLIREISVQADSPDAAQRVRQMSERLRVRPYDSFAEVASVDDTSVRLARGMLRPEVAICEVVSVGVDAAVVIGVSVGYRQKRCYWTDGTETRYLLSPVAALGGIGIAVGDQTTSSQDMSYAGTKKHDSERPGALESYSGLGLATTVAWKDPSKAPKRRKGKLVVGNQVSVLRSLLLRETLKPWVEVQ